MTWWVLAGVAAAQTSPEIDVPRLDTQQFRPTFDSRTSLWAESAGNLGQDGVVARAFVGYLREPLVFVSEDGDKVGLVNDALGLELLAAYRYDRFRLGVDLPVYLFTTSDLAGLGGAGTGDLSVDGRVTVLDGAEAPIGLAFSGRVRLPTASVDVPLGSDGLGGEIVAIATKDLEAVQLNLNVGQRFLPSADIADASFDDELFVRLGGGYAITEAAGVSGDLGTSFNFGGLSGAGSIPPIEVLAGGWGRVSDDFVVRGGLGRGLTPGIGSPVARALVSLSYEPSADKDTDGDGFLDDADACATEPEDADGFEDDNGCPDPDNDGDTVLDAADLCPLVAEDLDEWNDTDGCPDPSRQIAIKVVDEKGALLPSASLTVSGPAGDVTGKPGMIADLHDGTYVVSASAASYLDAFQEVQVPLPKDGAEVVIKLLPAAKIGVISLQTLDPDGNPVKDATWEIDDAAGPALDAGTGAIQAMEGDHFVVVRAPGFGPARVAAKVEKDKTFHALIVLQPSKVKVTKEQINLDGTVYFETGKAVIKAESFGLLDEIAQTLIDNPDILKVRIEGHTDSRGAAAANLSLSEKRAASVLDYLAKQGVGRDRLSSAGYGETKPIDAREVEEAWTKNRRVDFFIDQRAAPEEK